MVNIPDCMTCGGACCKRDWDIVFDRKEPVPRKMSFDGSKMVGGCLVGERMMRKNPDGSCVALRDGLCSIYDTRPMLCREFEPGDDECYNSRSMFPPKTLTG